MTFDQWRNSAWGTACTMRPDTVESPKTLDSEELDWEEDGVEWPVYHEAKGG